MKDKKLQRKILTIIKNSNESPNEGINYLLIKDNLRQLVRRGCYMEDIIRNLHMLVDEKKIEVSESFFSKSFYQTHIVGQARLTSKGYKEFDNWHKLTKILKFILKLKNALK